MGARSGIFFSAYHHSSLDNDSRDLDVVISVPSLSNVPTEDVFADIARVVRSFNFADPGSLELLSHARVPLLKFQSLPDFGSYQFDVSLEHARDGGLGAIACLAILDKLDEVRQGRSDRVKGLVFAIKTLLQSKGLGSARDGSLGGMSIFCLVVSFVQVRSSRDRIIDSTR